MGEGSVTRLETVMIVAAEEATGQTTAVLVLGLRVCWGVFGVVLAGRTTAMARGGNEEAVTMGRGRIDL